MEKLTNQITEIDEMTKTLEAYLEKWKEMKVTDYRYTINKFETLITALRIHRNMCEAQLDYYRD